MGTQLRNMETSGEARAKLASLMQALLQMGVSRNKLAAYTYTCEQYAQEVARNEVEPSHELEAALYSVKQLTEFHRQAPQQHWFSAAHCRCSFCSTEERDV